jgi:hypothetical protein
MEVAARRAHWTQPDAASFLPEERIDLRDAIDARRSPMPESC